MDEWIYCSECGEKMQKEDNFCEKCGARNECQSHEEINVDMEKSNLLESDDLYQSSYAENLLSKKKRKLIFAGGGIFFLIIIGISIAVLGSKGDNVDSNMSTIPTMEQTGDNTEQAESKDIEEFFAKYGMGVFGEDTSVHTFIIDNINYSALLYKESDYDNRYNFLVTDMESFIADCDINYSDFEELEQVRYDFSESYLSIAPAKDTSVEKVHYYRESSYSLLSEYVETEYSYTDEQSGEIVEWDFSCLEDSVYESPFLETMINLVEQEFEAKPSPLPITLLDMEFTNKELEEGVLTDNVFIQEIIYDDKLYTVTITPSEETGEYQVMLVSYTGARYQCDMSFDEDSYSYSELCFGTRENVKYHYSENKSDGLIKYSFSKGQISSEWIYDLSLNTVIRSYYSDGDSDEETTWSYDPATDSPTNKTPVDFSLDLYKLLSQKIVEVYGNGNIQIENISGSENNQNDENKKEDRYANNLEDYNNGYSFHPDVQAEIDASGMTVEEYFEALQGQEGW